MISNSLKIAVSKDRFLTLAPWVLWLMVLVLPLMLGKLLLEKAIEIDRKLWLVSTRQMLMNEAQKYKTSLNPSLFLANVFDKRQLEHLYATEYRSDPGELKDTKLKKSQQSANLLRQHPVTRHLPWGSSNVKKDIAGFLKELKEIVGSEPNALFCLGPDAHSRFYSCQPAFDLPVLPQEFDQCLAKAYRQWLARSQIDKKSGNFLRFYHTVPELQKWLGFFYPPQCEVFGVSQRFSGKVNDPIQLVSLSFKDALQQDVVLNLCYQHSQLKWQETLKRVFAETEVGVVQHRFGYSSLNNLPHMRESDESIDFIFELPSDFKKIFLAQVGYNFKKVPVLHLSVGIRQNYATIINKTNISFFLRLFLLLSLSIPIGINLHRFSRQHTLKILLAVSFAIGALVPLSGLTWLTVSFVNSQKYFEAEKVFTEMNQHLELIENKMLLQKARNEIYFNLLVDQAGKLSPLDRRRLPELYKKFSHHQKVGGKKLKRPIVGYYMLNRDGFEMLDLKENYLPNLLQIKPFFSGFYNEMLLAMGSFNQLSQKKRQEIEQKAQLALGVTEHLADRQMFSEIAEFERSRVCSTMTVLNEFFSGFFLDAEKSQPGSILVIYSENSEWIWQIHQLMRENHLPVKRQFNGYKITTAFFRLDRANLNTIRQMLMPETIISLKERDFLMRLGRALFINSGNHAINNLAEKPANLILAKVIAEKSIFAVTYAEKQSAQESRRIAFLAALVILIAFISSIILAFGTAKLLLGSLPVFLEAISQVQQQNLNWQLEINSGDEFEDLGRSFNLMGRKLLEREKMSQLVSENVMEAISATDENMLRPGGEKRHAAILFSDIRGFTSLSEKYQAEEIVEMLNSYFSAMASIISENGGIIDKLIGDAIQAVFYQGEGLESAELRSARAAVAMKKSLKRYNIARREAGKFIVNNGIGIASGEVIAGRVGSETGKLDATVLGAKLKLAESLESKSKFALKESILVDGQTANVLEKEAEKLELLPFQPEISAEKIFELVRLM